MTDTNLYKIVTPSHYPEGEGCYQVIWDNSIFMPFDIISGLDSCPPDNWNYKKYKKTHWWVCPKTKKDICSVHDISMFIDVPQKEFKTLDQAIKYCFKWRKKWLKDQLKIK